MVGWGGKKGEVGREKKKMYEVGKKEAGKAPLSTHLQLSKPRVRLADALDLHAAGLLLPAGGLQLLGQGILLRLLKLTPAGLPSRCAGHGLQGLLTGYGLHVQLPAAELNVVVHLRCCDVNRLLAQGLLQVLTLVLCIALLLQVLLPLAVKQALAVVHTLKVHCEK